MLLSAVRPAARTGRSARCLSGERPPIELIEAAIAQSDRSNVLSTLLEEIKEANNPHVKTTPREERKWGSSILPPMSTEYDRIFAPAGKNRAVYEATRMQAAQITAAKKMLTLDLGSVVCLRVSWMTLLWRAYSRVKLFVQGAARHSFGGYCVRLHGTEVPTPVAEVPPANGSPPTCRALPLDSFRSTACSRERMR
jgi:hypothetical protein